MTNFQRNKKNQMLSDGVSLTPKEDGLASGSKKSVIDVFLTEDESLPGPFCVVKFCFISSKVGESALLIL